MASADRSQTLVDLLLRRAEETPERRAFRYLITGDCDGPQTEILWGELVRRAKSVAVQLREHLGPGERVVLVYPPDTFEFVVAFFGSMLAGTVAVPVYPPDPARLERTLPTLRGIVDNSGAGAVLTANALVGVTELLEPLAPEIARLPWVASDAEGAPPAADWRMPEIRGETLAFLQYTSGSTGMPKGVMVGHGNLLHNAAALQRAWEHDTDSNAVGWLPLYHDGGLMGHVVQAVFVGCGCTLMSPLAFLQRPLRWLHAVSHFRATTSGGPNFAYDLCVRKATERDLETLDLGSWQIACNAAEPVRPQTLDRFVEVFGPCGFRREAFYPCYGLAETTLLVCGGRKEQDPVRVTVDAAALEDGRAVPVPAETPGSRTFVSSGSSWPDHRLLIVDPVSRVPCAADEVGEIWVAGRSVAQGYWDQPERTAETFGAHLATGDGPFLRTGDLGFSRDDEIFVTGRLTDLIIIAGANRYPQDIEASVERAHARVRPGCCAAFAVEAEGAERLVVVAEVEGGEGGADASEVEGAVRRAVAEEHGLRAHDVALLKPRTIPKTSSGKIQRRACREAWLAGQLERTADGAERGDQRPAAAAGRAAHSDTPTRTEREVEDWLVAWLAEHLGIDARELDPEQPFAFHGLDSQGMVLLSGDAGQRLGRPLPTTIAYDHPTPRALARHLTAEGGAAPPALAPVDAVPNAPIAVIGIGCRLPGGAGDPDAFWRLLGLGFDAISEVPADRWDVEAYFDDDPEAPGKTYTRRIGALDAVDTFDAAFFGISPREARAMDPQQRLLLEVSWEALEHAGIAADRLAGSSTGVFVGMSATDYASRSGAAERIDAFTATGNALSTATGRISYTLGLQGPSLTVDTACSSSLVAVHLACQSLRSGESSLALAGGVNLILSPHLTIGISKLRALSPDGRCKAFDASADGYGRGEGCAMVVLKPLAGARDDGDDVLAVIRGTAVNQDGRTSGLTAPNGPAQQAVIARALRDAAIQPGHVDYVEAHGTGTPLGDPIEIQALDAALGADRDHSHPLLVGSVKTNLGHLEAAAGITGLVKTVLAVRHGEIPRHLHFAQPSPYVPWEELRVAIPTGHTPWPATGRPRIAGVSSFGFSGTNAHVVVEEAPPREAPPIRDERPLHLLTLSARTPEALREQARRHARRLEGLGDEALADVCHTARSGRCHFEQRLAALASTADGLRQDLAAFADGRSTAVCSEGRIERARRPRIAFLFTGQGSQYPDMGRALYRTQPVFRDALDRCAQVLDPLLEAPLLECLYGPADRSRLDQTAVTQPCLFALEYALAEVWRSFGIVPDFVMGHSVGEYAAACVAGVFGLEEALWLVAERGRLMQALPRNGAMMSVQADAAPLQTLLAPYGDRISVAAINGPRQIVLSGERVALEEVRAALEAKDVKTRALRVSHAFHSSLMEPILDELERAASRLKYELPRIPLVSNVSGRPAGREICSAGYWRAHARSPVQFAPGMSALSESEPDVFLELGPHPALLGAGSVCLPDSEAAWLPSLREGHEDWQVLLRSLAHLYTAGVDPDWTGFDRPYARRRISLPTYPFQRKRHWLDVDAPPAAPARDSGYAVEWRADAGPAIAGDPPAAGSWLILADRGGIGEALAAALEREGQTCRIVRRDDTPDAGRALPELVAGGPPLRGVVHLWALDAGGDGPPSPEELALGERVSCEPALLLAQLLASGDGSATLWAVTRGAQPVGERALSPVQSTLWGLGRVIASEHPELWGGLVDLDPDPPDLDADLASLVETLLHPDAEDQIALRGGCRYVARLVPVEIPVPETPLRIEADRTYLIAGGLGSLGLELARWLVERKGARHLILMGRSGAGDGVRAEAVAELRRAGAEIVVAQCDVARHRDVERRLREARDQLPPLAGVFHTAGVLDDGLLVSQDWTRFAAVLAPKVRGAWNLHLLTRDLDLDFFVLFSSAAALLGAPGQASYAAGNAFLDALAHQRRSQGLPALSVDWGPWAGAGMAGRLEESGRKRMASRGIGTLRPATGIRILEAALAGCELPQLGVFSIDWSVLLEFVGLDGVPPLLAEFAEEAHASRSGPDAAGAEEAIERLRGRPPAEARNLLTDWIATDVARVLGVDPGDGLDHRCGFSDLGMDSLMAVELRNRLRRRLGLTLPVTVVVDHPTVESLVEHLAARVLRPDETRSPRLRERAEPADGEPIAIIGASCRFPGAGDVDAYWRLLRERTDAIAEVPPSRWDLDAYFDADPDAPGRMYSRWGGFLDQVDRFDPHFFRISPREAQGMDPQQRLLLEVGWEALENAGQDPEGLVDARVGVFVGVGVNEYGQLLRESDPLGVDAYSVTGNALSVTAGRISYALGLRGPTLAVDTACSSSLVAVHLACQSLRSGESNVALAGAANVILAPDVTVAMCRLRALSPNGRCKAFDASADGYVRSEGCGVVVLKRLSDARADGDRILAVVRGSAVNHDGHSSGLTVPNGPSQEQLLRDAVASAGVDPADVQYVEAHGTGTSLGDPIELQALGSVLAMDRPREHPLVVGSVKTNIGHLEAAAGIAGLIKTILALHHGVIPSQLHFREPNPHVPWDELNIEVAVEPVAWRTDRGAPIAGVSAFGLSGTNAHVVLEGAPAETTPRSRADPPPWLLPISARCPEALREQATRYAEHLERHTEESLTDVCFTAATARTHHDERACVVGASRAELVEGLRACAAGEPAPDLRLGRRSAGARPRVAFVFPGQGAQWLGMGRELLAWDAAFREALQACDAAVQRYTGWTLIGELQADASHSRLDRIDVVQPVLFGLAVSLAAWWRACGIEPSAVVGHSQGEIAAAHVAGVLSLDDAARIVCRRSELLLSLSGKGAMAVVELTREEAEDALSARADRISIAASNSRRSTVLSGEIDALRELIADLEQRQVFCRWIKSSVAGHSPQTEPLREPLLEALAGLDPRAASVPMLSTVLGRLVDGPELGPEYWMSNLRQPVLFADAIEQLAESGHDAFVELSPHPILLPAIDQLLLRHPGRRIALPTLRRGEERMESVRSLGAIYTHGCTVDWRPLYRSGAGRVSLPTYPFQRERCWFAPAGAGRVARFLEMRGYGNAHPLLGKPLVSSLQPGTRFWETALDPQTLPYLGQHRIQGVAVLPAAVSFEMAYAAAKDAFGERVEALEEIAFLGALAFPENRAQRVQLAITEGGPRHATFRLSARPDDDASGPWKSCATGSIRLSRSPDDRTPEEPDPLEQIRARCERSASSEDVYGALAARGVECGPAFRGLREVYVGEGEALGRVRLPSELAARARAYQIHPCLMDACLQVLAAALAGDSEEGATGPFVLVGTERLEIGRPVAGEVWSHARVGGAAGLTRDTETIGGDVTLRDQTGAVLASLEGLRLRRLAATVARTDGVPLHAIAWEPTAAAASPAPDAAAGRWLLLADASGGVADAVQAQLEALGGEVVRAAAGEVTRPLAPGSFEIELGSGEAFGTLLCEAFPDGAAPAGVVHLWSLDAMPAHETTRASLVADTRRACASALHLIQALAQKDWREPPRLWLVTREAQATGGAGEAVAVSQTPLWGLARAIALEHPELRSTLVDLGPAGTPDEAIALANEILSEGAEDQVALRPEGRRVARLDRRGLETLRPRVGPAGDRPFRLVRGASHAEAPRLQCFTPRPPGPGEVQIAVDAASLLLPPTGDALQSAPSRDGADDDAGTACAGRVVAVGEDVADLSPGQRVVALASCGPATHVTVSADRVAPCPRGLEAAAAAALPVALLTARHGLLDAARLQPGERVLIHPAGNAVGRAAVQIARRAGAEVFAVSASPAERDALLRLGADHVLDADASWAAQLLEATHGEGADVVLSAACPAPDGSRDALACDGRFVVASPARMARAEPAVSFDRPLSFHRIDVLALAARRPARFGSLLREAMSAFEADALAPLPCPCVAVSDVTDADRTGHAENGSEPIVVTLDDPGVPVTEDPERAAIFRPDATYLVTGGLGEIGLALARWMVDRGARHLLLLGRSGPSPQALQALAELERAGARVRVARTDVTNARELGAVLEGVEPALAGVFHLAGVLDDGFLVKQSWERFESVLAPKVEGAWNLHELTRDLPLDHFVLYSSGTSVLGAVGAANYAAANAFLDGLAHHRHAGNRAALSINWGMISGLGMARTLEGRGVSWKEAASLPVEQAHEALALLLRSDEAQVGVFPFDARRWSEAFPSAAASPTLSRLRAAVPGAETSAATADFRSALAAAEPRERIALLETLLREELGRVLRLDASRVDPLVPLEELGVDSLMGLELRNRLEAATGVSLSAALLWTHPNVVGLAQGVAERLVLDSGAVPASHGEAAAAAAPGEDGPARAGSTPESVARRREWFVVPRPVADPRLRLLCFAYAGGSAAAFRSWPAALPADVEVRCVQLPGRIGSQESPFTRLDPLLDAFEPALLPWLDRPFAAFGHSLGAILAFELARRLRAHGETTPAHLFLSGIGGPRRAEPAPHLHDLPEVEFIEAIRRMGGTPPEVLDDAEVLHVLLPILRADLAVHETHVPREEEPLDVAITAIGGTHDPCASRSQLDAWRAETSGRFALHLFPGGHFFVQTAEAEVLRTLADEIAGIDRPAG